MQAIDLKAAKDHVMANYPNDPLLKHIVLNLLEQLPKVDAVEVVHGRWKLERHKIFGRTYDYVCSICGCDYALAEYNYCPNCGAKMDGGT